MLLAPEEYQELENETALLLHTFRLYLEDADIQHVEHYLKHAEIEMAFESLGLSLMARHVQVKEHEQRLTRIGALLGLDRESVFDDHFWRHFTQYLSQQH